MRRLSGMFCRLFLLLIFFSCSEKKQSFVLYLKNKTVVQDSIILADQKYDFDSCRLWNSEGYDSTFRPERFNSFENMRAGNYRISSKNIYGQTFEQDLSVDDKTDSLVVNLRKKTASKPSGYKFILDELTEGDTLYLGAYMFTGRLHTSMKAKVLVEKNEFFVLFYCHKQTYCRLKVPADLVRDYELKLRHLSKREDNCDHPDTFYIKLNEEVKITGADCSWNELSVLFYDLEKILQQANIPDRDKKNLVFLEDIEANCSTKTGMRRFAKLIEGLQFKIKFNKNNQ